MSNHCIEVRQLRADHAFMNVDCGPGRVMVWTHAYRHPTLLVRNGDVISFVQFDSEEWMREWINEHDLPYLIIEHLDDIHKRPEARAAQDQPAEAGEEQP